MSNETERPSWPDVEDEPSSSLARALAVAREDDVNAAQVARLALALAPVYGASIVASSAHAASTASAASVGQAGATAGASATAGLGTAASMKIASAVLATVALGAAGLMTLRAPAATRHADAPRQPAAAQERTVEAAPPQQALPLEPTPATPDKRVAADRAGEAAAEPPAADSPAADSPAADSPAAGQTATAAPRAPRARAEQPKANPPVEAQLLTEAHAALVSDATRALRLADEHRARFPHGALAAERELLAVRALEQQGRAEEAKRRIARARRELPRSAPVQRAAERLGALP